MSARADFLVELGTEELPPKSLRALSDAFRDGIVTRLAALGLAHGKVESFATPRRLAVRVQRLAAEQPAQQVQRRGPPVKAAFDASGAPTRAATAFAQSCGVDLRRARPRDGSQGQRIPELLRHQGRIADGLAAAARW